MAVDRTITQIKSDVGDELNTISGIGVVIERPRDVIDTPEFIDTFIDASSSTIKCWIIDVPISDDEEDPANHLFLVRRTVIVDGFLTFNDNENSQETFTDLVDLVLSKIKRNATIFGSAPLSTPTGVTVNIDFEKFGGKLCHHARIEFQVESEETIT